MSDDAASRQPAPDSNERFDADLNQLRRTADWLGHLTLARLAADDRRIGQRGAALVQGVDSLTRQVCGSRGHQQCCAECPPTHASPHRLGDASLGVQLVVFIDQLARVLHTCGLDEGNTSMRRALRELAQEALALRSGSPFG